MSRLMILFFLSFLASPWVLADCVAPLDTRPFVRVSIAGHWEAQHVSKGLLQDGCILQILTDEGHKTWAYTSYSFLCNLSKEEKIEVAQEFACCDTGEMGDFACGIKPIDKNQKIPQLDLIVRPFRADKRAIADLMAALSNQQTDSVASIVKRLLEYSKKPKLKATIEKEVPNLEKLFNQKRNPTYKSEIARLLLNLSSADALKVHGGEYSLALIQGRPGQLDRDYRKALKRLEKQSNMTNRTLPALMELYKSLAAESNDRMEVLKSFATYGTATNAYLTRLYPILKNNSALFSSEKDLWEKIVCGSLPKNKEMKSRRVLWEDSLEISPIQCQN